MGLDVMKIGVCIRRGLIFPIRNLYRSVRDHPFYWGVVFFFIFLYRFFPSLFELLVNSSPVLVCTAVLLGTLLSFGNPNIPEIEKDGKRTHEVASLKAAVVENDLVVQKDESFSAEAHLEKRREVEEKQVEEKMGLEEGREANVSKVDEDMYVLTINNNGLMVRTIANEEEPKEILGEKQMIKEGEFGKVELVEKREFHEEESLIGAAPSASKDIDGTNSVGWEEIETPRRKIDLPSGAFSITQDLAWKHAEGLSDSYDSVSDRTESSSPDSSMAGIMPMLDELHPLLESQASQPPLISFVNFNAVSESSNRSNDGNAESEEEGENQEEEDDEEEEAQGTQGDGTKDVVTWTEDDQKNLMDLGTLELERNRRLESLIAKRRLRKLMRMESEKNLIDLDSNDPPFSIAPILTARQNPFDLPYDSYEAMGLPPIPGSAPPVLLPRRNPFDLPYEPYEEKPNLMDDSFQQEFMPFQPKDLQFRRHESFSLGVSAEPKQRRHFRPYFVTERMASEGAEYAMFERQLSEKSDSRVSSVPETESTSSVADQEDHKTLPEQELSQEGDLTSHIDHASDNVEHESESSKELDLVEIDPEVKRAVKVDGVDIKGFDEEGRLMHVDGAFDHVEHEIQSSAELDSAEVYPGERRDFVVDGVNMNGVDEEAAHEVELHRNHSGSVASLVEPHNREVYAVEEKYSNSSSSSSEMQFRMDTDEGTRDPELNRDDNTEGSSVSIRLPLTESDFNLRNRIMECGDESQTKEPVYDLSPSEIEKTLSNMTSIEEAFFYVDKGVVTSTPSIASDLLVEVSEVGSPTVLVDSEDGESVYFEGSTMEISHGNERTSVASPNLCTIDENESTSIEITEISECNVIEVGFLAVSQNSDDPHFPKMVVGEAASGSSSSSLETQLVEVGLISEEVLLQSEQDQISLSSSKGEIHGEVQQHDTNMKLDTMASSYSHGISVDDSGSSEMEKFTPLMEEFTVYPSSDGDHEETQDSSSLLVVSIEEANVQAPPENVDSSNLSMSTAPVLIPSEVSEIKPITVPTDIKDNIHVRIQCGNESLVLEKSDSVGAIGPHVSKEEFSEETEGIKEIDEGLLSELDTVGHFSVKELGLNMDQKDKKLSLEEPESLPELQALGCGPVEDIQADSDKLSKLKAVTDSADKCETRYANFEVKDKVPEVTESTSKSQVLEPSFLGNVNVDFKQIPKGEVEKSVVVESIQSEPFSKETEVEFAEFELTKQDPNPIKIGSELPALEARSLKDIESDFKELNQGFQEPIVTEPVHDKSITEGTEIGPSDSVPSERGSNQTATNSELPVVEARSLEDIDVALKKIHEGLQNTIVTDSFHDKRIRENSEVGLTEFKAKEVESSSTVTGAELPVLEARSLEDIDRDFKQSHVGDQKAMVFESFHDKPTREETVVVVSESGQSDGESKPTEISSELQVLEVKSVEDSDLDFMQLHGGDLEKTILPESVDDRPSVEEGQYMEEIHLDLPVDEVRIAEDLEVEVKEMETAKESESSFEESGTPQETRISAEESSLGFKETSESSSLSTSAVVHKKSGSHKPSSSASSSSSSSSSDSE